MALPNISLAQFNSIATGDYNAGQIDFRAKGDGSTELVKVNNFVWRTSKNNVVLSHERILEVKEAFLNALERGGVGPEAMKEIRDRLGLPADLDVSADADQRNGILTARFRPLTRAQVRDILDTYANEGRGFTLASRAELSYGNWQAGQETANMSAKHLRRRDNANVASMAAHEPHGTVGVNFGVTDAISLLSASRSLAEFDDVRGQRCTGTNAVNEKLRMHTAMVNSFQGLASQALKLLPAGVRETPEFKLMGETVKLVKGNDGSLSAIIGKGNLATKVALKMDADTFAKRLLGRVVADAETLGESAAKNILGMVYDHDLEGGLVASEKTSITRQFAALILANKSGDQVGMDALVNGTYNTGILVEMAERALAGEDVGNTKALLDAYHAKLVSDNASLPAEMKAMLENVANLPLEKSLDGEFIVRAPIVGDINHVVQAMPQPVQAEPPKALNDIGGLNAVKDFVADLVFSDDTMVGDVTASRPGEAMRKMLTDDKNIVVFAEIIKNPDLIDTACAHQIADAVKDGLGKMVDILAAAFKSSTGKELFVAATEDDFLEQLSQFMKDANKLPGKELSKFDNLILSMANKGCERIQLFINDVFKVGNTNVNAQGGIVNEPYKGMSAEAIKAQLDGKSLNQILDTASNADSPGQVGFFRQVISNYFTSLDKADKRSCFAAALKYAQTFDFAGLEGEARVSAQKAAVNKFTGAVLKGTSPLLQKMMQGLPKDIMGEYAEALDDMKCALAPIPRKIVQAHFMQMINESKGKGDGKEIESIELKKSLGAASVGEAFLCAFKIKGEKNPKEFVVKIMRHDAERRVKAEADIFTAAAEKIGPGMAKTWEGQLKQYMTEFDFQNEVSNAKEGVKLYDVCGTKGAKKHPLSAVAPNLKSMHVSDIVEPKKDVMVAEVAGGNPVDKYFKGKIGEIRKAASVVFEQNPATGRVKWADGPIDPKTNKPKPVPILKKDVPTGAISNVIGSCYEACLDIKAAQEKLLEATKAWFHEALFGSGKFHGDTHAGNLMVNGSYVTFIDFGNLYQLKESQDLLDKDGNVVMDPKTNQPVKINERHELLRVIMGATFRDKSFFLEGLEKLLSPAGKAALEANRGKAEAILDSILSKGKFSYDIVYRLNAAIVELQKLGLELPPQINCFVQSMARLANTVSEMNSILNQTRTLLDSADAYQLSGPAPERDPLDLMGMASDFRASPEGQVRVPDNLAQLEVTHADGTPFQVSTFMHHIGSEGFGGFTFDGGKTFQSGGKYYNAVSERVTNAQNPVQAARDLVDMLTRSSDVEHNPNITVYMAPVKEVIPLIEKAGNDQERADAIKLFTTHFCTVNRSLFDVMETNEGLVVSMRALEEAGKIQPKTFASALMGILMDNFDSLSDTFEKDSIQLKKDVYFITSGELKAGWFAGEQTRVNVIKEDARKMPGEDSYQVDVGV